MLRHPQKLVLLPAIHNQRNELKHFAALVDHQSPGNLVKAPPRMGDVIRVVGICRETVVQNR